MTRRIHRYLLAAALATCTLHVRASAAAEPGSPWEAEFSSGSHFLQISEFAGAEQHFKTALQMVSATTPDDPRLVKTLTGLVTALRAQRKYAEAEPLLERRMGARRQPANPLDVAKDLRELGQVTIAQKKFLSAQKYFQSEAEMLQRRFGIEYPALATAWLNAASAAHSVDKASEAQDLAVKAAAILDKDSTGDHSDEYRAIGDIYAAHEKWTEAEQAYRKAVESIERASGPEHISAAPVLEALARIYTEQGDAVKAEGALLRLLSVKTLQLGNAHPATAPILEDLGGVYTQAQRFDEAASLFERAHEIRRNSGDPAAAATMARLTDVYVRMGKLAETEPLNRELFVKREQELLTMVRQYAANQTALGRYPEADILYGIAIEIYERAWPQAKNSKITRNVKPSVPPAFFVETLEQHAQVLRKMNKKKEASRLEKQARPLREILQARDSISLNNGNKQLAGAL
jgi:tetratricopeptide (TPR) repeat protein